MTISTNTVDGVLTVAIEGAIDVTTAGDFEKAIKDNLSFMNKGSTINSIVLDFSELEYISSAGIRILLMIRKQMTGKGGLVVRNINEVVRDIFKNTGLLNILDVE